MTGNTVNVLNIYWAGEIMGKPAWNILNGLGMYQVGIWLVLCTFPCNVLAMYQLGTPLFVPSVNADHGPMVAVPEASVVRL